MVREADGLPPRSLAALTNRLQAIDPATLGDDDREQIRDGLRYVIARHRAGAGEDWALPREEVDALAACYERLAPADPVIGCAWLFSHRAEPLDPDGDDWKARRQRLDAQRAAAVREVSAAGDAESILRLAMRVEDPTGLGITVGTLGELPNEEAILDVAAAADRSHAALAAGYIAARARLSEPSWIPRTFAAHAERWTPEQCGAFLAAAPPSDEVWTLAARDSSTARAYWTRMNEYAIDEPERCLPAARALVEHGRALAAAELLAHHTDVIVDEESADLALTALERAAALPLSDANDRVMRPYYLSRILDRLEQVQGVDEGRAARLEWLYLPLLGEGDRPAKLLQRLLADDPGFFAEVVTWIFKGASEAPRDVSDEERARARLGYELLEAWRLVPGRTEDGSIDRQRLDGWVDQARAVLAARDRAYVGDARIGHVLAQAAPDADGVWPPVPVRDLIERLASTALERGIAIATSNSRGVTMREPTAGGDQERALAARYRDHAERVAHRWPRTAAMLRMIADGFEADARREDIDAEYTEDTWR